MRKGLGKRKRLGQPLFPEKRFAQDFLDLRQANRLQLQPGSMQCQVAVAYNVLLELSVRASNPSLNLKMKELGKAMNFSPAFGVQPEAVRPGLAKLLGKTTFEVKEASGPVAGPGGPLAGISQIVKNRHTSYPLAALGSKYLEAQHNAYRVEGDPEGYDHVVIVCDVDEVGNEIGLIDPFEGRAGRAISIPRHLSIPDFIKYWEQATPPYSYLWLEGKLIRPLSTFPPLPETKSTPASTSKELA